MDTSLEYLILFYFIFGLDQRCRDIYRYPVIIGVEMSLYTDKTPLCNENNLLQRKLSRWSWKGITTGIATSFEGSGSLIVPDLCLEKLQLIVGGCLKYTARYCILLSLLLRLFICTYNIVSAWQASKYTSGSTTLKGLCQLSGTMLHGIFLVKCYLYSIRTGLVTRWRRSSVNSMLGT